MTGERCHPCDAKITAMLKEACRLGGQDKTLVASGRNADLCRAYEGWVTTGDFGYIEQASAVAPPGLLQQAKAAAQASGIIPKWA